MTTFADLNKENRDLIRQLEERASELTLLREQHDDALALLQVKEGEVTTLQREKRHAEIEGQAWEEQFRELTSELRQKFMLARAAAGDNIKSAMVFTTDALRFCAGENVLEEIQTRETQDKMMSPPMVEMPRTKPRRPRNGSDLT